MMKPIIVDKIASVTQACVLSHQLRISTDIPCEEGVVLAVEILTDKADSLHRRSRHTRALGRSGIARFLHGSRRAQAPGKFG
ncbi:MAG: hypothetical protein ACRES3_07805 [Steroidobacteraceae bacterium]